MEEEEEDEPSEDDVESERGIFDEEAIPAQSVGSGTQLPDQESTVRCATLSSAWLIN